MPCTDSCEPVTRSATVGVAEAMIEVVALSVVDSVPLACWRFWMVTSPVAEEAPVTRV